VDSEVESVELQADIKDGAGQLARVTLEAEFVLASYRNAGGCGEASKVLGTCGRNACEPIGCGGAFDGKQRRSGGHQIAVYGFSVFGCLGDVRVVAIVAQCGPRAVGRIMSAAGCLVYLRFYVVGAVGT
jgi:hypothetical protein